MSGPPSPLLLLEFELTQLRWINSGLRSGSSFQGQCGVLFQADMEANWAPAVKSTQRPRNTKSVDATNLYSFIHPVTGKYLCTKCDKAFKDKSGLFRHNQGHTGVYSYFCEICKRGFTCKSNFDNHMAKHEGRFFPCDRCDKRFSSKSSLQTRYRCHTG